MREVLFDCRRNDGFVEADGCTLCQNVGVCLAASGNVAFYFFRRGSGCLIKHWKQ